MPLQPRLSIITVTYNAAEFIEPTIRSIEQQTYPHIEYVIVDGVSKDNTLEIIGRYPQVVTVLKSEKDKGLYDAMNKAIDLATGDYVMFINAGDLLYSPAVIADIFAAADGEDILYGDTAIIDKNYQFVGMRHLQPPVKLTWKSFRKGMVICHQSIIAKRSLVPKYDLTYRIAADIDWAIRLTKESTSSRLLPFIFVNFMQDGVSTQYRYTGLRERFAVMRRHYGLVPTLANNLARATSYFLSFRFLNNVRK